MICGVPSPIPLLPFSSEVDAPLDEKNPFFPCFSLLARPKKISDKPNFPISPFSFSRLYGVVTMEERGVCQLFPFSFFFFFFFLADQCGAFGPFFFHFSPFPSNSKPEWNQKSPFFFILSAGCRKLCNLEIGDTFPSFPPPLFSIVFFSVLIP